jgi:hypothetical protein
MSNSFAVDQLPFRVEMKKALHRVRDVLLLGFFVYFFQLAYEGSGQSLGEVRGELSQQTILLTQERTTIMSEGVHLGLADLTEPRAQGGNHGDDVLTRQGAMKFLCFGGNGHVGQRNGGGDSAAMQGSPNIVEVIKENTV